MVLSKAGKRLDDVDSDILWNSIVSNLHVIHVPRTSLSSFREHLLMFRKEHENQQETIEQALKRMGIDYDIEKFTERETEPVYKEIDVLIPVRYL